MRSDFDAGWDALAEEPEVQTYALKDANQALLDLKARHLRGAKVLVIE